MEVFYGGCKTFEGHVWVCRPVVEIDAWFGFPALLWSMRHLAAAGGYCQPAVMPTVCTYPQRHLPSLWSSPWVPANFYTYLATGAGNIASDSSMPGGPSQPPSEFSVWLVTDSSDLFQTPSGEEP